MEPTLVKLFAIALALSQVFTRPGDVKTRFDPVGDRAEVVTLLQAGCAHLRHAFGIEAVDMDDLLDTALADPKATGDTELLHGMKLNDLLTSYKQFCKNEPVPHSPVDLGAAIAYYNKAAADLPDAAALKGKPLAGATEVLDAKGAGFAAIGRPEQQRIWVPLSAMPAHLQQAFVAAEDKRFFSHHGFDEQGMIRAFLSDLGRPGRPQGGSTITQQVAKNLFVGADVTFARKIREIIVASRLEHALTKPEILALYLNSVYLGRGAWGVEMAARRYFGKHASQLTLAESAVLAALTRGPTFYGPDRHPERTRERLGYVLARMQENGAIEPAQQAKASARLPHFIDYQASQRDSGYYFVDQVAREATGVAAIDDLGRGGYTVHSTIVPALQRAVEAALQESLAQYEMARGRQQPVQPETNLAAAITAFATARDEAGATPGKRPARTMPAWQQVLQNTRLPLYDVHWPAAIVLPSAPGTGLRVGLADGRILPLRTASAAARAALKPYDVVYVALDGKRRAHAAAALRSRPRVQGATIVIDNKSGRILAMAGGFSYPLSQLNRATQVLRQPGSTLKPVTYLAALAAGLRPDSTVRDEPITLGPPDGAAHQGAAWTPRNDNGDSWGEITLRSALENSRNLATAHLLDGGIADNPKDSLARVCALATAAQLYARCEPYYPFILGAQPVRMVDLAAFYAAIANDGVRPTPHTIEQIERNGKAVYRFQEPAAKTIGGLDPANFEALRGMLAGVVAHGTARSIRHLAGYVAGKTGTTTDVNDAWFVGFSNTVTVAVWVGYDNGGRQHDTLGQGDTGNSVAAPIFEKVMDAAWASLGPRTPLQPPAAPRQMSVAHARPGKARRAMPGRPGDAGEAARAAVRPAHKLPRALARAARDPARRLRRTGEVPAWPAYDHIARDPAPAPFGRARLFGQQDWPGRSPWTGWDDRSRWDEQLNAH